MTWRKESISSQSFRRPKRSSTLSKPLKVFSILILAIVEAPSVSLAEPHLRGQVMPSLLSVLGPVEFDQERGAHRESPQISLCLRTELGTATEGLPFGE